MDPVGTCEVAKMANSRKCLQISRNQWNEKHNFDYTLWLLYPQVIYPLAIYLSKMVICPHSYVKITRGQFKFFPMKSQTHRIHVCYI